MLALLGYVALQNTQIPLDQLDLKLMSCGWSRPQSNASISGQPLRLGGKTYAKGIGTHASSVLNLALAGATSFDAVVGVDDDTDGKGSVEFVVWRDGKPVWQSGVMRGGQAGKPVHIDLAGAKTVSLRVTDAGDGETYDHADWANATITTSGVAPKPIQDLRPVIVATKNYQLTMFVDDDGRLMQRDPGVTAAFPVSGNGWTDEAALSVRHADGNLSTELRVVDVKQSGNLTRVLMRDVAYPLDVTLCFRSVPEDDVIESWTEIEHREKAPVVLSQFASSSLSFGDKSYWMTQFHGDWANEANMSEEKLSFGTKTIDSKLGVRADLFRSPWFLLSQGGPAKEDEGIVFGGTLAWSSSYAFKFDVDPHGSLRAICGMNPAKSEYRLAPNTPFVTPTMVWGWSNHGTGELSRKLHHYVRSEVVRDGNRPRSILLNNWEATFFTFNEKKLVSLFGGAKELGMELFLLDDGWFGKKYPRESDNQGLGDWIADPKKLPNGLGALPIAAKKENLRFGIWLEPEMVNPRSELFEMHPDWVIQQPKRPLDYQRNQLILDLSNPAVEKYVYDVCDRTLRDNPGISYIKWDCNRYISQPGSPVLGPDKQSHLTIEYGRALYRVMAKLAKEHPDVELMLCSGGGGRVDYGSLRFGHEFWPSDNTNPANRIFIQWGYSHFFPPITSSNHVTKGEHSLKYTFDVAMSGRLGMDYDVDGMSADDRAFAARAVATYKSIRDVVQLGEQYRLQSPYDGPRSALMNVKGDRAVVFVYSIGAAPAGPLKLKGLSPMTTYSVKEINRRTGEATSVLVTGDALMSTGLAIPAMGQFESFVYEVTASGK